MAIIPQELLKSLNQLDDFDESAFIDAHQADNLITSIRLNPFKKVELDFELAERVLQ